MVDHSKMKLGKAHPRHDTRTLQLANYLRTEALPPPPESVNWGTKVTAWPMMRNDTVGDCTCAAAGHLIQEWTANASSPLVLTDDQIIAAYSAITGYDPKTGANDHGAVELDVLNYWRQTGIGGQKIEAFVALEPRNTSHIKIAVDLFGGCYIGLALPASAQRQTIWSVPPGGPVGQGAPNSWSGHAVPVVAYDMHGLTVVTWGALKQMTWEFWLAYCDEAYATLSPNWTNVNQKSPAGIDINTLRQDLKQVTG